MTEISRIRRSVSRANAAFERLEAAQGSDDRQAAWEEFLPAWRTALNQIYAHCRRAGLNDIVDAADVKRRSDPILDYVWEARNAEEHTPDGTSNPALVTEFNPITWKGETIHWREEPVGWSREEQSLAFRPLVVRRGQKQITLSPPQDGVWVVAYHSLTFLLEQAELAKIR